MALIFAYYTHMFNMYCKYLFIFLLDKLPESIWEFLWGIQLNDAIKISIFNLYSFTDNTIEYKCRWAFYYGLNMGTDPMIVNILYLKNLLTSAAMKNIKCGILEHIDTINSAYLVEINYEINSYHNTLIIDLARNKFIRNQCMLDSHKWQPVLFGRVSL